MRPLDRLSLRRLVSARLQHLSSKVIRTSCVSALRSLDDALWSSWLLYASSTRSASESEAEKEARERALDLDLDLDAPHETGGEGAIGIRQIDRHCERSLRRS